MSTRRDGLRTRDSGTRRSISPYGFTLIELLVAVGILALVVALLLPATRTAREPARRTQCKNNLKQIGLALYNYESTYGAFPPAYTVDAEGKPLHSWRTLILPFLDQKPLYDKIDLSKPWDDPVNEFAHKTIISAYCCPSAPFTGDTSGYTTYLGVVTSNSAFCATRPRKVSEITDGTSNTVMVIEAPFKQSVHWMSPQDADESLVLHSLAQEQKQHQHVHAGGEHALLADGTTYFLSQNISPATLLALISAAGGDKVGEF